jgi:peroxiredoxin-like protein
MNSEHYYNVEVNWQTDRKGLLTSSELDASIEVVTPPQFPKGIPKIWSPEHLFVAAVNSCLMTTFLSIAENSKLEFESFISKAIGKLEIVEGKYIVSEITLLPVVVTSEQQKEKAERVLQKSETNCLISNSVKSKIIFKPSVQIIINS